MQEIISISLKTGFGNLVIDFDSLDNYKDVILDKINIFNKIFIEVVLFIEIERLICCILP